MIPTIEAIVDGLVAGTITPSKAVTWLHQHAQDANTELRDYFAAAAVQGFCAAMGPNWSPSVFIHDHDGGVAADAYGIADAMLKERAK